MAGPKRQGLVDPKQFQTAGILCNCTSMGEVLRVNFPMFLPPHVINLGQLSENYSPSVWFKNGRES